MLRLKRINERSLNPSGGESRAHILWKYLIDNGPRSRKQIYLDLSPSYATVLASYIRDGLINLDTSTGLYSANKDYKFDDTNANPSNSVTNTQSNENPNSNSEEVDLKNGRIPYDEVNRLKDLPYWKIVYFLVKEHPGVRQADILFTMDMNFTPGHTSTSMYTGPLIAKMVLLNILRVDNKKYYALPENQFKQGVTLQSKTLPKLEMDEEEGKVDEFLIESITRAVERGGFAFLDLQPIRKDTIGESYMFMDRRKLCNLETSVSPDRKTLYLNYKLKNFGDLPSGILGKFEVTLTSKTMSTRGTKSTKFKSKLISEDKNLIEKLADSYIENGVIFDKNQKKGFVDNLIIDDKKTFTGLGSHTTNYNGVKIIGTLSI